MSDSDSVFTMAKQTRSITRLQLIEFVDQKNCNRPCEACGESGWSLAAHDIHDDDSPPALIKMQNVRDEAFSAWFFWMHCNHCGHVRTFNAGLVWDTLFGDKNKNGQ